MRGLVFFALGAACGALATAWIVGVRPDDPPQQVTVLTRRAPPAPPPVVAKPEPPAIATAPAIADAPAVKAPVPADTAPLAAAHGHVTAPIAAPIAAPPAPQAPEPVVVAGIRSTPIPPASENPPESRGSLAIPVAGFQPGQLSDNFNQRRGKELHEALDIMAPRGTPVVAVEDGKVVKLFTSKAGGLTIYQFDPTEKYAYYYAHLDHYAQGIVEGRIVRRGEVIGYVGSTGNASANAPHLHFSIFVLGPEKRWWKGKAINPYPVLTAAR